MLRYLPILLAAGVTLYAFIDCARTEQELLRGLPKWAWLLIIFFLGIFGAIAFLIWGRQRRQGPGRGGPRRVIGPVDDPDFLRKL